MGNGSGGDGEGIASRIRFRDGKSHDGFSFRHPGKEFLFLFFASEKQEFFRAKRYGAQLLAQTGVHPPEFFHDNGMLQKTQARGPVRFIDECAEKPQFARFFDESGRKCFILVAFSRNIF